MSGESPASRASQIARQMLLFGRPIPMEELVDRLSRITVERLSDLAARLFGTSPTLTAIGPIGKLAPFEAVRGQMLGQNGAQRLAV